MSCTWRSTGTEASMTPLSPPMTKVTMKPTAKSIGVLKTGRPFQMVAIQAKTWMPLGMLTVMLAAVKKVRASAERPTKSNSPSRPTRLTYATYIWFSKARTEMTRSGIMRKTASSGSAVGTATTSAPAMASRRTSSGNSTSKQIRMPMRPKGASASRS